MSCMKGGGETPNLPDSEKHLSENSECILKSTVDHTVTFSNSLFKSVSFIFHFRFSKVCDDKQILRVWHNPLFTSILEIFISGRETMSSGEH